MRMQLGKVPLFLSLLVFQQSVSAQAVSAAAEPNQARIQKWEQVRRRNRKPGDNKVQHLNPEVTEWTSWFNIDHPGGNGDFERLEAIRFYYRERVCARPRSIEARTTEWVKAEQTGEVVHYSPDKGFWCINKEQPEGRICSNYHIRFQCPVVQAYWSNWSAWSSCSVTACGHSGIQARQRTCTNNMRFRFIMAPKCKGKAIERRDCSTEPCREAHWTAWGPWSACSVSCGTGHILRRRSCVQTPERTTCIGRPVEVQKCSHTPCAVCQHVCTVGHVNEECNGCVCDRHVLLGTVHSANGVPISRSRIAMEDQPHLTVAMSNKSGFFKIPGICANNRTRLLVESAKFAPSVFQAVQNGTESSVVKAVLERAEKPYLVKHPETKVRFEGERVYFCCKATGSPSPLQYVWYHNGTLLDIKNEETLLLKDLQSWQGGQYQCKVSNGISSIKSVPATLTVIAKGRPNCKSQPLQHFVKLPENCFQKATKSFYYNVGKCPNSGCAGNLNFDLRCKDSKRYCCGVKRMKDVEIACEGYTLPVKVVASCSCKKCLEPKVLIRGRAVAADNGEPLRFGQIFVGNERVGLTGYKGTFTIQVPQETERLVVQFIDKSNKFVDTVKVFPFDRKSGAVYFEVKLLRKSKPIEIDSTKGITIPLGEMEGEDTIGKLEIAPNSFRRSSGESYQGKVKASVTFLDPRNITLAMTASSDLSFVDEEGDILPLRTYGMFSADFREELSNEALEASNVKVYLDTNSVKMPEHVEKMKLWSLNPDTGFWEEESLFHVEKRKRNKREERTFLIGNMEIRERRLFNLDVPEGRRCYVKVRAYMSEKFLPSEQLEGVVVTLINLEPLPGYTANPRAWGRFDSVITGPNGACLPAFCDAVRPDAYTAYVTATLGAEELEAAASSPKMNPNIIGVSQPFLGKLDYRRTDHEDEQLKKTAFKINLAKPNANNIDETNGPIYAYQDVRECEEAPISANHFRFYKVEKDKYEYNVVPFEENDLTSWTGNYLSWWPNPQEFRACYIKVKVNGPLEVMVRSRNAGGTHSETAGQLYGIRDARSVRDMTNHNVSAACLEFKCGGMLFDQSSVDRTLVTVIPQGSCRRTGINTLLQEYLRRHPPSAVNNETSAFSMLAPVDPLGHNYGIYTVTDQNPRLAKEIAIGRCFDGTSDGFSREMKVDVGNALTFSCQEKLVTHQSLFQRLQSSPAETLTEIGAEMRRQTLMRPAQSRIVAYPSGQRSRRARVPSRNMRRSELPRQ
ncbi:cartilage intermediate layer protein 1 isoform X2 [Hemiscyllium ocellatum]|uniref:cartilage intermediate layer protein 1 isoform X2 n=1 Tax=Hemiscyllium ocellatum TaxID=170820 RepID=UPI0029672572|nr:cartilage intermediate layer protein 1 isoform X2 [Hemiscyllium ocellatum]